MDLLYPNTLQLGFYSVVLGAIAVYPLFLIVSDIETRKDAGFTMLYTLATFCFGTLVFGTMVEPMLGFDTTRQLYFIYMAMMGGLFAKGAWYFIIPRATA